jgi:tetratricopeptide (TPR) repeat protein
MNVAARAMKYRSWLIAVGLASVAMTIWLPTIRPPASVFAAESHQLAAESHQLAADSHDQNGDDNRNQWHPPLTITNPYLARPNAQYGSLSLSSVAADAPPLYRLPGLDEELAVVSNDEDEVAPTESDSESTTSAQASITDSPVPCATIADSTEKHDMAIAANDDILPISAAPSDAASTQSPMQLQSVAATSVAATNGTTFSATSAELVPYMPVAAGLSAQQLPAVQRAYALAQRGSLYAAETEFVQVLRRIAQAKDADEGYDDHSRSLAAGLRALDEADDFAPSGVQLEAEMNVAVTASSHRTPVLRGCEETTLPQEAIAQYHCYARQQLGEAVAGEQAGSMALHGLGKVYCRLAEEAPNDARSERKAMTMFLAALDAGPQNHLAANEVGVLLSRGGHQLEAAAMFRRAIDVSPSSTAYHNLAVAEQKLGQREQATADGQYGDLLAARERSTGAVSRSLGIRWVSPQELAGVAQPQPLPPSQAASPMLASRTQTPLGPSRGQASAQPTHTPSARWW